MLNILTEVVKEEFHIWWENIKWPYDNFDIVLNKIVPPAFILSISIALILVVFGAMRGLETLEWMSEPSMLLILLALLAIFCLLFGVLIYYAVSITLYLAKILATSLKRSGEDVEDKYETLVDSYRWFYRGTYTIVLYTLILLILSLGLDINVEQIVNRYDVPHWLFDYIFGDTILSAIRPLAEPYRDASTFTHLSLLIWIVLPSIFYSIGVKKYFKVRSDSFQKLDRGQKMVIISFGTVAFFSILIALIDML